MNEFLIIRWISFKLHWCKVASVVELEEQATHREIKLQFCAEKKKGKDNIFTLTTTWMIRRIRARWFTPLRQRRGASRRDSCFLSPPMQRFLCCSPRETQRGWGEVGSVSVAGGRRRRRERRRGRRRGREGDSIYVDGLRRPSAVMMRDETTEVLDKEEWNESKVQGSDIRDCCWMRRKPEMRWGKSAKFRWGF